MEVVVATNNKFKLNEIKSIFNEDKIYTLKEKGINIDIEEDCDTFLRNAKNMNDTSWATFTARLAAKGKDYNCNVIKADRYFPSSQLCSKCGFQYHDLKLSEREWTCSCCGTHHIRDVNAAINLKNYVPLERRKLMLVEDIESLAALALQSAEVSNEAGKEHRQQLLEDSSF